MFCPFLALGLLASKTFGFKNLYQICIFLFQVLQWITSTFADQEGFESGCSSKILVDAAST